MPQRRVTVASRIGLHARPAMLFAQAAAAQPVKVRIGRPGGAPVDASSVIWVLTLDVRHGEDVILTADGPAADQALDNLAAMLSQNLDRVV